MANQFNLITLKDITTSSHQIDDHSIFGDYNQGENRVMCALLRILQLAGNDLIDKLIEKFGGEVKKNEPDILTQVSLDGVKGTVADGLIIRDCTYKIVIEAKIAPFSTNLQHNLDQLAQYRKLVSQNDDEYILYITPDSQKPKELEPDIFWLNWDDITQLLNDYLSEIDDQILIFLIKEFIKLIDKLRIGQLGSKAKEFEKEKEETEKIAKEKIAKVDISKESNVQKSKASEENTDEDEDVLIVGGRWGEKVAIRFDFYACQANRFFLPTKYLAFYYDNRIKYLFEIIFKEERVLDLRDKKWGIDPDYFQIYDLNYINDSNKEREFFRLKLIHIFDGNGIVNDSVDKNGKRCAFTQRQRYTTLKKILKVRKTSEL